MVEFHGHECPDASSALNCGMGRDGTFPCRHAFFHGVQVGLRQCGQGAHGSSTGHGVSSKSGDVTQRGGVRKLSEVLAGRGYGTHGHAAPKGLAHAEDVGLHTEVFKRPRFAGAPHAALNLIQDQEATRV